MKKIKIDKEINRHVRDLGIAMMTLATMLGMLELPSHTPNRVLLPAPVTSLSSNNASANELNNPIRREKEGSSPEYVSYSESQRTPGRAGKY